MVALEGGAVSYERGTPVLTLVLLASSLLLSGLELSDTQSV